MDHGAKRRTLICAPWLVLITGGSVPAPADPVVHMEVANVRATDAQPDGPAHSFVIATREITNDQFGAFLNDALSHPDDARGHFLYHDTDTADVYIHADGPHAEIGSNGAGTLLFDASDGGDITFAEGRYSVAMGREDFPVVGVSWYGAVKYCNWLTLDQGGSPDQRAYSEGPLPEVWHPVVVDTATWASRDLSPAERLDLVTHYSGYRLPMDGGASIASVYNEWYKAAAWNGTVNTLYAFGRDSLTPADANYQNSGDPYDNGPSPAGYFDGTNHGGAFTTTDTANRYGLYDLCGNVSEWVQDVGTTLDTRRTRGGNWSNVAAAASLKSTGATVDLAGETRAWTGFRVVRAGNLEPLAVTALSCGGEPDCGFEAGGPAGGPFEPLDFTYTLQNLSSNGAHYWSAGVNQTWISIDGQSGASGVIPQGAARELVLVFTEYAAQLMPAALPYLAELTIHDLTTGDSITRDASLLVWEPISVSPVEGLSASGMYGGPFEPDGIRYTLRSESASPMAWRVITDCPWVAVNGAAQQSGEVPPLGMISVNVRLGASAYALLPGDHADTITFENLTTGYADTREVLLTVVEPIELTPDDAYEFHTPYQVPVVESPKDYTLTNVSSTPIAFSVTSNRTWISVDGGPAVSSTLSPRSGQVVSVSVNDAAASLAVGTYLGTVTFTDSTTGSTFDRSVTLVIEDPVEISPSEAFEAFAPYGGPISPLSAQYRLQTHPRYLYPVDWIATSTADWVLIDGQPSAAGSLVPGVPVDVTVQIDSDTALALPAGAHTAPVRFETLDTGFFHTRDVILTIGPHIAVDPPTGLQVHRTADGELVSSERIYTITNVDSAPNGYRVTPEDPWVWVNYGLGASGTLGPYAAIQVRISVDTAVAGTMSSDESSQVHFENLTSGYGTTARSVKLVMPNPVMSPPAAVTDVPGDDAQPGGPSYTFSIGRFEVTNQQFVTFLNDALDHPADERGAYLYHDTDSGNVYVHSQPMGEVGSNGAGTFIFNEAANAGRVVFNLGTGRYELSSAAFVDHPVAGVTWYGAVKFCNWLTLDQGYGPSQRCYSEGSPLAQWHPATISASDWASRNLTNDERHDLVTGYAGYRLPMDAGATGAAAFDEWYKAAAWRPDLGQNMTYGFGRNTVSGADANYKSSGDPWDDATTPVGYYDGSDHGGTFATVASSNGYGLHDLCGNLFEWVQDFYGGPATRAARGGAFVSSGNAGAIGTAARPYANPSDALPTLGFRVLRTAGGRTSVFGDFDTDGDADVADFAAFESCISGPDSPPVPSGCVSLDSNLDGHIDLADFSVFQRFFGP